MFVNNYLFQFWLPLPGNLQLEFMEVMQRGELHFFPTHLAFLFGLTSFSFFDNSSARVAPFIQKLLTSFRNLINYSVTFFGV